MAAGARVFLIRRPVPGMEPILGRITAVHWMLVVERPRQGLVSSLLGGLSDSVHGRGDLMRGTVFDISGSLDNQTRVRNVRELRHDPQWAVQLQSGAVCSDGSVIVDELGTTCNSDDEIRAACDDWCRRHPRYNFITQNCQEFIKYVCRGLGLCTPSLQVPRVVWAIADAMEVAAGAKSDAKEGSAQKGIH